MSILGTKTNTLSSFFRLGRYYPAALGVLEALGIQILGFAGIHARAEYHSIIRVSPNTLLFASPLGGFGRLCWRFEPVMG